MTRERAKHTTSTQITEKPLNLQRTLNNPYTYRFSLLLLSAILLLCLLDMPYGYYQFVRIVSFVLSGYFTYIAYNQKKTVYLLIFITAGLLFNPIFKVALGKEIWRIVDIGYAAFLIMILIIELREKRSTATNKS